jgi:ATP-dependent DNA helicase DinG
MKGNRRKTQSGMVLVMVNFCRDCGAYIPAGQTECPSCSPSRTKQPVELKQISPAQLTPQDVFDLFPSRTFREHQKETIMKMVEAFASGIRCIILVAPTGAGKSYVNASFTSATRSFYATPQLALLDQIMRDPLLENRFVEIKGRQNYRCYYNPGRGVHVGKCETEQYPCNERLDICPYWMQKMRALKAPSVLLSLAYLISEGQTEGRSETYLGTRSLLVLDEAHNLEDQCLNHISVRLSPFSIPYDIYDDILPALREVRSDVELGRFLEGLESRLSRLLEQLKQKSETSGLSVIQTENRELIERYLASYYLYMNSSSEWVWQIRNNQLLLQPVFAKEFMKQLIWKRAEYYIISSATILDPKEFAELTGLTTVLNSDEICVVQAPSTFPPTNRPIIDVTVGSLSKQEWERNRGQAVKVVAEILRKEKGKVAIHSHSYHHQRALVELLPADLKPRLIVHTSRDREEKLNEWMHSRGKVFVSVAFNEGQDWKYDLCSAQILLKVPFADLSDRRMSRRLQMGHRGWYENQAMMEIIQAYGRAIRADDDKARFYVVDGSFQNLVRDCWPYIPDWFKEALPPSFQVAESSTEEKEAHLS